MKILISIWKLWRDFWDWDIDICGSIDSHKWESKIEAYKNFSGN